VQFVFTKRMSSLTELKLGTYQDFFLTLRFDDENSISIIDNRSWMHSRNHFLVCTVLMKKVFTWLDYRLNKGDDFFFSICCVDENNH